MTENKNTERYVRVKAPDKEALASLLMKAKGPNRSLRKFADEIGVNASTLSRISTQKTLGLTSPLIIEKIAKHADPESGVTLDMLMNALGLAPRIKVSQNITSFFNSTMNAIVNELLLREYQIHSVFRRNDQTILDSILGRCICDLTIRLNAFGKKDASWMFNFFYPNSGSENEDRYTDRIRQWLLMFTGMVAYNETTLDKFSIVLSEENQYRKLLKYLKGYNTSFNISVILVDLSTEKVVEEYVIKYQQPKPIFYQIADPMISEDSGLRNLMDTAEITLNMNSGNESGGSE